MKKSIKNIFFVCVINFIFLFVLLCIIELVCTVIQVEEVVLSTHQSIYKTMKPPVRTFPLKDFLTLMKNKIEYQYSILGKEDYIYQSEFTRSFTGKKYEKEDIVLAGCSFTQGYLIKSEDTFGAVLAEAYPKYKVYNIAVSGGSAREILYIMRNYDKFQKYEILPSKSDTQNTKYFIYTFMTDQKIRVFCDLYRYGPKFHVKKNQNGQKYLEYNPKFPFYEKTFTYWLFVQKCLRNYGYLMDDLFTLYIQELKKEVDDRFPNAEFVFISYNGAEDNFDIQVLKQMGIKVLILSNMTDICFNTPKYQTWDNDHPNRCAWETIVSLLSNELDF